VSQERNTQLESLKKITWGEERGEGKRLFEEMIPISWDEKEGVKDSVFSQQLVGGKKESFLEITPGGKRKS